MNIKNTVVWLGIMLMAGLLATGCGKGSSAKSAEKGFASAPPEIKALWDQASAADKANDYVTATVVYKQILRQQDKLKEDQVQIVQDASGKLFQRLVDASTKGDPAARQALSTLGSMDRSQRP